MDQVYIRRAFISDMGWIVDLISKYRRFFGYEDDDEKLYEFTESRLSNNESVIFIACKETPREKPVGIMQLYPLYSTLMLGKIWVLNDFFIEDHYRGMGLGQKMVDWAIDFASSDGAIHLDLKTQFTNLKAMNFYEKYGFDKDVVFMHYRYTL